MASPPEPGRLAPPPSRLQPARQVTPPRTRIGRRTDAEPPAVPLESAHLCWHGYRIECPRSAWRGCCCCSVFPASSAPIPATRRPTPSGTARAADGSETVRLYYFFSPTCPHCQAAKPFIAELERENPWLEVKRYAVKDHRGNARFYYETAQTLGVEALSVPGMLFCRQIIIGYDDAATTGKELADALRACHERRLANPGAPDPSAAASVPPPAARLPWPRSARARP